MAEVLKIFISATSADLGAARRAARDFFNRHDHYKAREQQHRSSVPATLLANDQHHLEDCDAVLHIVGECYGQEPRATGDARRSYTQREFDYAIKHGKPLYLFVCADGFPYKKHKAESQVKQDLQRAHREAILTGDHKRHLIADPAGLDRCLREIALDLQELARKLQSTDPLQRYYKALRLQFANHDSVSLPVSAVEREDEKEADIKIRDLFVPPRAAPEYASPAAVDLAVTAGQTLGEPLLPLLQKPGRRVVLLADPGMGKSTVIQFLIATLIDEQPPAGAPGLRGAVPFPFILRLLARDLPADVSQWNWDALLQAFRQWNPGADADGPLAAPLTGDGPLFRGLLQGDRAFFLIDGLDEIGDETRRLAIRAALWEGFERHPEARWLITSRLVGYEQAEVHQRWEDEAPEVFSPEAYALVGVDAESFSPDDVMRRLEETGAFRPRRFVYPMAERLYLVPFDDTQQRAFAKHWYVARMNAVTGAQRGAEFVAAVHQHPHTRVIGRIPNLLHLLALLYRYRKSLPHGRALIYGAISEAYLHSIPDYRQLIQAGTAFAREFTDKEKLLAIVGMKMHQQLASRKEGNGEQGEADDPEDDAADKYFRENDDREILVSRSQLEEWIGAHFADAKELAEFLDHVARHSGLLLPRGEDRYGFAHLSFQEYYAACQLQQDFLRISSAKIQAGSSFLRRPAAAAGLADERIFAEYAALPVWHEPLLFLVEKLRVDEHATARLIEWMFPQFPDDPAKGKDWMPFSAARLLATLSIDPEVALHDDQRAELWQRLWQAHCAAWHSDWNIAPSLVGAGSTFQSGVLRAAVVFKPERLHFVRCSALSDLSPLAGLTGLQTLNLASCTGLGDLTPLAGLISLQELILNGCTRLGDLTPLAGLTGLQELRLRNCPGLGDLTPLAGLTGLRELILEGCPGLSDLSPLAGLTGLQTLVLNGCTGLDDLTPLARLTGLKNLSLKECSGLSRDEIEKLQNALPKTRIHS